MSISVLYFAPHVPNGVNIFLEKNGHLRSLAAQQKKTLSLPGSDQTGDGIRRPDGDGVMSINDFVE